MTWRRRMIQARPAPDDRVLAARAPVVVAGLMSAEPAGVVFTQTVASARRDSRDQRAACCRRIAG